MKILFKAALEMKLTTDPDFLEDQATIMAEVSKELHKLTGEYVEGTPHTS